MSEDKQMLFDLVAHLHAELVKTSARTLGLIDRPDHQLTVGASAYGRALRQLFKESLECGAPPEVIRAMRQGVADGILSDSNVNIRINGDGSTEEIPVEA